MKKLLFLVAVCMTIVACNDQKSTATKVTASEKGNSSEEVDSAVYGKYLDGGNFTMELLCGEDTVTYVLPQDTDIVLGDRNVGDKLMVVGTKNADGENVAEKVVNLTTLSGKWKGDAGEMNLLEIDSVRMFNGNIIVAKDTFSVYSLGADSLELETKDAIYQYKREK